MLSAPHPLRLALGIAALFAPVTAAIAQNEAPEAGRELPAVEVEASADASAQGLSPAFTGGQVARGARAGILGTRDALDTPFSTTSYTNELILDRQSRSVGEVLRNDPGVRNTRGFGNFQESYFIRGFVQGSDDVAYNGLYGLLPRQYIAAELFERVEVLRGASAFLNGASPNGGGLGGSINLVPKRAFNEPLTRLTSSLSSGPAGSLGVDVSRRFGPDGSTGIRLNAALRGGGTGINEESARTKLLAVGLDWRSGGVRVSGDIGWQDNRLARTRPSVTLSSTVTTVPDAPQTRANFAQPWSYSNERDLFGTLRAELDVTSAITAWAALGMRRSEESNSLANLTVTDASTGAGTTTRFDNTRQDRVLTGEAGIRGVLDTGALSHEWVVSASSFSLDKKNAYAWDFFNPQQTGLFNPVFRDARPDFSSTAFTGGDLSQPGLTGSTRLHSLAVGDTISLAGNQVQLTLGLRHQQMRNENFDYTTGVATDPAYDASRISPMAALLVRVAPGVSAYANYAEGLSQGDTAPADSTTPGRQLAPYVTHQTEVGLKLEHAGFGASLALFSTRSPRSMLDARGIFSDAGRDRHRGAELQVYGEAARGLRLLGGVTWLSAKQLATGVASTEGRSVIGVPTVQGTLGAEWDVAGMEGLTVDGRMELTGARWADSANTLRVPGVTTIGAGVRWLTEFDGRLLTVRARVDNLTNRRGWASVGGYPGAGYLVTAAPRTVSLSVSADF